jgi:uncharacterized protein
MTAPGFVELLALQDLDVRLDQLRHRRNHHPLVAELRSIESSITAQQAVLDEIGTRKAVFDHRQADIEAEIERLDHRRAEVEKKLYDGSVNATKDLLALQTESAHLGERKSGLEDVELEIMELLEPIVAELEAATAVSDELSARRVAKQGELESSLGDVQHELVELEPKREALAAGIDQGLRSSYESSRVDFGGVAVARFVGTTCSGCHLSLSAMEVDRIRHQPADAVVRCPECNRLLVR